VSGESRGYILEVFDGHFILPNLGPIGNLRPFYNKKTKPF
jgi:homogentisate 1,2-dioxygenase